MRITVGLLSIVLFAAFPASAQEMVAWERFFPGEVGDYWTYDEVYEWCIGYDPPSCETTTSVQTYEVTARAETDTSVVLDLQTASSFCRLSITEGAGWFTVEQLAGEDCLPLAVPPGNLNFPQDEPAEPAVVEVNGYNYTVDALKGYGEYPFGGHRFAADLGMYEYFSQFWSGDQQFTTYHRLIEAEVEGVVYGIPVAVEPDAPPALDIALYPNPFSDRLTFRADAPTTRFVAVEVVDVTGRRVLETEVLASGRSTFDLTTLAPGVYVVRIVAPDGTMTVRRITKVR